MNARLIEENRRDNALFCLVPAISLKVEAEYANLLPSWSFGRQTCQCHPHCLLSWRSGLLNGREELVTNILPPFWSACSWQMETSSSMTNSACILPAGSAATECTFSPFRKLKTYLRSRKSEEWLSVRALTHIHQSAHWCQGELSEVHAGTREENVSGLSHQADSDGGTTQPEDLCWLWLWHLPSRPR